MINDSNSYLFTPRFKGDIHTQESTKSGSIIIKINCLNIWYLDNTAFQNMLNNFERIENNLTLRLTNSLST